MLVFQAVAFICLDNIKDGVMKPSMVVDFLRRKKKKCIKIHPAFKI